MARLLIVGCGGVASVAIHKCCQNSDVFTEICIASRTLSKCDALKDKLSGKTNTVITTAKVDADNVDELVSLTVHLNTLSFILLIEWASMLVNHYSIVL